MAGTALERLSHRKQAEPREAVDIGSPGPAELPQEGTPPDTGNIFEQEAAGAKSSIARNTRARARSAPGTDVNFSLISRYWIHAGAAIINTMLLAGLFAWTMPPALTALLCTFAVAITVLTPKLRKFEKAIDRPLSLRILAMFVGIGLPMALYGYSISYWAEQGTLPWSLAIGALIAGTSLAAVIQNGKAPGLFTAQICCWSAVALVDGSAGSFALLGTCVIFAVLVSVRQSISARINVEKAQERERIRNRAEDILTDYEETGQGWFWETDRRGMLTYVSHTVAQAIGRQDSDKLISRPFIDLFDLNASGREGERTLTFHLSARSAFSELEVRAASRAEERWWSVSGRPVYDEFDNFVGFRGSGTDLTEKKRSQEKASHLAHYDSLTGLANRFQMSQSLEKILNAPQEMQRNCTVFLLDLDRFKQVNDTMGHPAGDALLKQVAERLKRAVGDMGRVGRLGGDEFKVIIPGKIEQDRLAELAKDIIASVSQAYTIDEARVVIGASIGISIAPENGVTSEALIRNADLALYAAKDGGRGRYHFYAQDLHSQAEERRALEHDLRDAIVHGGLSLNYQPVVDAATEKITGFEALMRWNHPTKGAQSPQKFIEIAEDAGLIGALGEWALRTACHDLAKWPEDVRVAVNVSPLQFANPQLPAIVTNAVAQAGIDPGRLELEITESVFLNDDASTDAMFTALKGVGVRLALDDFGTGYSSLGYLKKAPFDKIKIDQSFVRGATQPESRNGAIIASITSLANALGMETTAEGVETLDELDLVRMHGCSHIQGYIYERPLTAEAASERLRTGLAAIARGPRSARSPRQTMLRKVVLDHNGQVYNGTIRNISTSGALIEGLWNVPSGTIFRVTISESHVVAATTRWCEQDRMGVEFATTLKRDAAGRIAAIAEAGPEPTRSQDLSKTG